MCAAAAVAWYHHQKERQGQHELHSDEAVALVRHGLETFQRGDGRLFRVIKKARDGLSPKRRPRTTKLEPGHRIYPCLLRGVEITRPNQV